MIGRNVLISETDKISIVTELMPWLSQEGSLILAETVSQYNQRLYSLVEPSWLPSTLWEKLKLAEEAIYQNQNDPMVNWNDIELQQNLADLGLSVQLESEQLDTSMLITPELTHGVTTDSKGR